MIGNQFLEVPLYKCSFDGNNDEKMISVLELFNAVDDTYQVYMDREDADMYNLVKYNDEMYFILRDSYTEYGNLYKMNCCTKQIELVDNNLYKDYKIYEQVIWGNGKYDVGNKLNIGLFYLNNNEVTSIYDGNIYSFYVDINLQKACFLEKTANKYFVKVADIKSKKILTIKEYNLL